MNVLIVNYEDFTSNSAIHIFNFANELSKFGAECGVCVPRNKDTITLIGEPQFTVYEFKDFRRGRIKFSNGSPPDIIHAWTPREIVRKFCRELVRYYGAKYVVHLEDNEEALLESKYHMPIEFLNSMPRNALDRMIDRQFSHPIRYKEFLADADGVTVITEKLLEYKPGYVLGQVIWPGFEEDLFKPLPVDETLKSALGIPKESAVVVYSGNVHSSNKDDVYSLYLAIATLDRIGLPVRLVRTGRNYVDVYDDVLKAFPQCFIELGYVDRALLPKIMSIADVFVQPGSAGKFNDYRFPSKVPEFLAFGRPVILPNTNIGTVLKDGYNCILLQNGASVEICRKIQLLLSNIDFSREVGMRGLEFARTKLSWKQNSMVLYDFYNRVLANTQNSKERSQWYN